MAFTQPINLSLRQILINIKTFLLTRKAYQLKGQIMSINKKKKTVYN